MVAKGEGAGRGLDWELGISKCKLFCTGWTDSEVLLYSTGNYTQHPGTSHNGKEGGHLINIYLMDSDFATCKQSPLGSYWLGGSHYITRAGTTAFLHRTAPTTCRERH